MNLPKDTDMNQYNLKLMLMLSGLYVIVGFFTIMVMNLVVSGDSSNTREQRETSHTLIMPPSIQRNQVKK
jgi:hypothetical protein